MVLEGARRRQRKPTCDAVPTWHSYTRIPTATCSTQLAGGRSTARQGVPGQTRNPACDRTSLAQDVPRWGGTPPRRRNPGDWAYLALRPPRHLLVLSAA